MSVNKERTLIMVKPDGVQRGLIGKIIERFEHKGFKLIAMKFIWPLKELLMKHYADLTLLPYFSNLIKYMNTGPVIPMVWEGFNVEKSGRQMLGATYPIDCMPATVRGDFCFQVRRTVIHASDAIETAERDCFMVQWQ